MKEANLGHAPVKKVFKKVENLLNALADFLVKSANAEIARKGVFTLVLSGGSSPIQLYELLVSEKYKSLVDWTKVYFFIGDERYVPPTCSKSNGFMARGTLLEPLHVPSENIFTVNTLLSPDEAALQYFDRIKSYFMGEPIHFDFILLGLGDDAHTASLFPHASVLDSTIPSVQAVFVNQLNVSRITFTAPLINQAKQIVFLVFGEAKADAVKHVLLGDKDINQYPAQLIHADHGQVYWFLDWTAAPFGLGIESLS